MANSTVLDSSCFTFNGRSDGFGDCCSELGLTVKPYWYYLLLTLPIELVLVETGQRDAGSTAERKTSREMMVFTGLTSVALALILVKVFLVQDGEERRCEGAWECYQTVIFMFANSSALVTCVTLWLRIEMKKYFMSILRMVREWINPFFMDFELMKLEMQEDRKSSFRGKFIGWLFSAFNDKPWEELNREAAKGTSKGPEHIFSLVVISLCGGLTHVIPGIISYVYLFWFLLLTLIVTHCVRIGPLAKYSAVFSVFLPPFVLAFLVAHLGILVTYLGLFAVFLFLRLAIIGPIQYFQGAPVEMKAAAAVSAELPVSVSVEEEAGEGRLKIEIEEDRRMQVDELAEVKGDVQLAETLLSRKELAEETAEAFEESSEESSEDDFDELDFEEEEEKSRSRMRAKKKKKKKKESRKMSLKRVSKPVRMGGAPPPVPAAAAPPPPDFTYGMVSGPPKPVTRAEPEEDLMMEELLEQEKEVVMELQKAGSLGDEVPKFKEAAIPMPPSSPYIAAKKKGGGFPLPSLPSLLPKQTTKESLAKKFQWVMKELKKLVLFDAIGHVILFASASLMVTFSTAANYGLLLFSGTPYVDIPVMEFEARDSVNFVECYKVSFTDFDFGNALNLLELVIIAGGVIGFIVKLAKAG